MNTIAKNLKHIDAVLLYTIENEKRDFIANPSPNHICVNAIIASQAMQHNGNLSSQLFDYLNYFLEDFEEEHEETFENWLIRNDIKYDFS